MLVFDVRTSCLNAECQRCVFKRLALNSKHCWKSIWSVRRPEHSHSALESGKSRTYLTVGVKSVDWCLPPFDVSAMSIKCHSLKQQAN